MRFAWLTRLSPVGLTTRTLLRSTRPSRERGQPDAVALSRAYAEAVAWLLTMAEGSRRDDDANLPPQSRNPTMSPSAAIELIAD
jgi:hypothetical protein